MAAVGGIPQRLSKWLPEASPAYNWEFPHLKLLTEHLEALADGEYNRLVINMPPQHGKSLLTTVHFPAYLIETKPTSRIMIGGYNLDLASKFSRDARDIVTARGVAKLKNDANSVDHWETLQGGYIHATGINGTATGYSADGLIVDDPIRGWDEARSPAYRDTVWHTYTAKWITRRPKWIVIIQTRWHEDDLTGRILNSKDGKRWKVLELKALADGPDPLGRAEGEALCPDLQSREDLIIIRDDVADDREWSSLYQQSPRPASGQMFNPAWFKLTTVLPDKIDSQARWWDFAGSTTKRSDRTAGAKVAKSDRKFYITDLVQGRWSTFEANQRARQAAQQDGPKVSIPFEQEPGSSGKGMAQTRQQETFAGFTSYAIPSTGSKEELLKPFSDAAEAGNIYILQATPENNFQGIDQETINLLLKEAEVFPNGAHDDLIEACGKAYGWLARSDPHAGLTSLYANRAALIRAKRQVERDGPNCKCEECRAAKQLIEKSTKDK